mmetsp:Transcript_58979/g.140821  ORF Transcript_58979/g.140821 Transcript_58979/m.140821 type:complete len:567 (+) Transcript_58979:139-1839(+)
MQIADGDYVGDTVTLRVRVGDANGFRGTRAGEVRTVFTLRAADDPDGKCSGSQVSDWQIVALREPADPSVNLVWEPCEASWQLPVTRCFRDAFLDTAAVHLDVRTRPIPRRIGELEAVQPFTALKLPVGKPFAQSKLGEHRIWSDVQWWQYTTQVTSDNKQAKGSLLIEIHTTFNQASRPRPTAFRQNGVSLGAESDSDDDTEAMDASVLLAKPGDVIAAFAVDGDDAASATSDSDGRNSAPLKLQPSASMWKPRCLEDGESSMSLSDAPNSKVNIFTINDQAGINSESVLVSDSVSKVKGFLKNVKRPKDLLKSGKEKLKAIVRNDTGSDRPPEGHTAWRQWTDVLAALNEIESKLPPIVELLARAARSMKKFGASHTELDDCARLSAYLADSMRYLRSEADAPKRLEDLLTSLEHSLDDFRGFKFQVPATAREDQIEKWKSCEDMQEELAILLESATMTAQQALGDYKKMHCRLELLVSEYEPVCKLELEPAETALPLLVDESARKVDQAALPERAVQWAVDFSQLVGPLSRHLEGRVREMDGRAKQVVELSKQLRAHTLLCVA